MDPCRPGSGQLAWQAEGDRGDCRCCRSQEVRGKMRLYRTISGLQARIKRDGVKY